MFQKAAGRVREPTEEKRAVQAWESPVSAFESEEKVASTMLHLDALHPP
jgi:hypothetical protein